MTEAEASWGSETRSHEKDEQRQHFSVHLRQSAAKPRQKTDNMNKTLGSWALGFGGMDGGNPAGPVWFCGIEWGAKADEKGQFDIVPFEITPDNSYSADGVRIPAVQADRAEYFAGNKYDTGIAKVCARIWMKDAARWRDFMSNELCAPPPAGRMFKMNLYPLNFPSGDARWWGAMHHEATGFLHKIQYKAWCMNHRFPFLRVLLERYTPRVLVCTGTGPALEFRQAFAPADQLFNADYFKVLDLDWVPVETFRAVNGKTQVMSMPFFGYGHSTDRFLETLGDRIRGELLPSGNK